MTAILSLVKELELASRSDRQICTCPVVERLMRGPQRKDPL